ncbi:hypothetical protein OROGR_030102 [Orobanche gracilis]
MDPVNEKVIVEQLQVVFAGLRLTDGPEVEMSPEQVEELDFDSLQGLYHTISAIAACDRWVAIVDAGDYGAFRRAVAEVRRRAAARRSGVAAASSSVAAASSGVSG